MRRSRSSSAITARIGRLGDLSRLPELVGDNEPLVALDDPLDRAVVMRDRLDAEAAVRADALVLLQRHQDDLGAALARALPQEGDERVRDDAHHLACVLLEALVRRAERVLV